ncbi:hypothetical protein DPMN_050169 [Dreissena polymorpha]|uniref:Uncharacterized protein n=1 Tax=Dreissena polymorpha TaxID=45954 RepID=A0A9D4CFL4_DREPO|nr:hypothetical protein DPMN_050169 [Dreissena polymorpha]
MERSSRGPDDPRLNVDLITGIYIERPRHPEYNNLQTRIDTFTDWPAHLDQDTRQLAELGFFHVGRFVFI